MNLAGTRKEHKPHLRWTRLLASTQLLQPRASRRRASRRGRRALLDVRPAELATNAATRPSPPRPGVLSVASLVTSTTCSRRGARPRAARAARRRSARSAPRADRGATSPRPSKTTIPRAPRRDVARERVANSRASANRRRGAGCSRRRGRGQPRCRRASYNRTAAATDTFSDSTCPRAGSRRARRTCGGRADAGPSLRAEHERDAAGEIGVPHRLATVAAAP